MANAEQTEILRQGKSAWNQWRQEHPELIPDLKGIDLSPAFFSLALLNAQGRIDLSELNFSGVDGQATSVSDADLHGADFSNANMKEMVFTNVSLARANLDGAVLSGAKFWHCDAPEASFWDSVLDHTVFSGANLQGANFTSANLSQANLEGTDLSGAELWKANLEGCNLDGARLIKANMQQINLSKANLSRCDMKYANLYEANLSEAGLDDADVRFADLRRANLGLASAAEIRYNKQSRFRGIRVSTCYGSPRFNRTANDQNYIEEFRAIRWDPLIRLRNGRRTTGASPLSSIPIGEWLYWIWWFSSDCGRSLWRWAVMSICLAALFGCVFFSLGESAFFINSYHGVRLEWSLETMILYSMSIFAKVNLAAITPLTPASQRWTIAAGVAGLITLGGLITILADKVARRA